MKSFLLPSIAAVLILLSGCGQPEGKSHSLPEPPRISQAEAGNPGGRLVLPCPGNPQTFNPLATDGASDSVTRLLFNSLVTVDMQTQQAQPGLAESWSVADDQKTWTFKLRKNLRWSDGAPLTADDVVFTWNEVMYNPNYNQLTYDLFRIGGKNFEVSKVDSDTVRVVTPDVFAPFLEYFGGVSILPKHKLAQATKENRFLAAYGTGTRPSDIVGSGPFRLKDFSAGNSVRLERNPEYCTVDKQNRRLPYFDEVELLIANTQPAYTALFLNGKADAFENIRREDWWTFQNASTNGHFKMVELGAGAERDFLWFNQNTGTDAAGKPIIDPVKANWFRNKKFRQAISFAIDRERLVKEVYGGRAQAIDGLVSAENSKWFNPNAPHYPHDVEKARGLLSEMGMKIQDGTLRDSGGNAVGFTLISSFENPVRGKAALFIQDDLKKLGIKLDYQPLEFRALLQRIGQRFNYDCALMGLGGAGTDPASQMNVLKSDAPLHQWFPAQKSPATDWEAELNAVMDAQMRTLDFAQRKKYFDRAQLIWADEQPMICLAAPFSTSAIRTNISNVRPSIAAGNHVTWNADELFKKP